MEPIDSFKSSSTSSSIRDEEVEAAELLDEYWFFENLFQRKTRMCRSASDPYPSSSEPYLTPSKSMEETFQQIATSQKPTGSTVDVPPPKEDALVRSHNLHRTPSLPPSIGREEVVREKESVRRTSKLSRHASLSSSNALTLPRSPKDALVRQTLQRAPSLPPSIESEELVRVNQPVRRTSKLTRQLSLSSSNTLPLPRSPKDALVHHNLQPLLPPSIESEEVVREKESVQRTNKFTRQDFLSCSSNGTPLPRSPKTTISNLGVLKHQPRREIRIDSTTKDRKKSNLLPKEVIQRSLSLKVSSKTRSELENEEVQGFKDLGFVFDKQVLNPSVINIIPGLQSEKPVDSDDDKMRKPYLSEAWLVQRSSPPMPNWIDGRPVDVKAQLKFWARAVATNVHQAC